MVPRLGDEDVDTNIFYVDRIFFEGDSGLWFMAKFERDEQKNKVLSALKYLQDEGFGTDRHTGNGLFQLA